MPTQSTFRDGLLSVIRHSAEPMVFSDPHRPDNPIVAANAAFVALTGYEESEIAGRNCRFLQGAKTDPETVRRIAASLRDQQGCIQWLANYRKDGSEFYNLLFISPVFAPDGTLLYFFANQHNLSEGGPDLDEFAIGPAHMPTPQHAEFHRLIQQIGATEPDAGARALESTLAAIREVAFFSTRLAAGPADRLQQP